VTVLLLLLSAELFSPRFELRSTLVVMSGHVSVKLFFVKGIVMV